MARGLDSQKTGGMGRSALAPNRNVHAPDGTVLSESMVKLPEPSENHCLLHLLKIVIPRGLTLIDIYGWFNFDRYLMVVCLFCLLVFCLFEPF